MTAFNYIATFVLTTRKHGFSFGRCHFDLISAYNLISKRDSMHSSDRLENAEQN